MRPSRSKKGGLEAQGLNSDDLSAIRSRLLPFPVWTSGNADVLVSAEPRRDIAGSAAAIPDEAHEHTPIEVCHCVLLTPLSAVDVGSAGVLKRYK
jgi:hypothetical protein